MVVLGIKRLYTRAKWFYLGKCGCIRQRCCIRTKVVVLGKVVEFGQMWMYSGKVAVIAQKLLVSGKTG